MKGAVASIVEVLEGRNDMQEHAKVLKAVLNTKSIQPAVEHVGF